MTNLRKRLADGDVVVGSWINSGSPIIAELMAAAGFDFLTIDAEHCAIDIAGVQQLAQAIAAGDPACSALVRVPDPNYGEIKRFMDTGVAGVITPLVNSVEQAMEVVRAAKYPPEGARGVGFARANAYGTRLEESIAGANERSFICIQIEHVKAVEALDGILAVSGIDAALVGPYDLTASMGITAQFDHPDYLAAVSRILKACQRHQVAPGIHIIQPNPAEVERWLEAGFRFIGYSLDITMLSQASVEGLKAIRRVLSQDGETP